MTTQAAKFTQSEVEVLRLAIAFTQLQSHRNLLGLTENESKDLDSAQNKLNQNW
jgi:hypothetical protein